MKVMPARMTLNRVMVYGAVFAAFLLWGAAHFNAQAATTYYVAPNGNDANLGTETAPWKTLKSSIPKLKAGDTLYVRGGTYSEGIIDVSIQGTADQPIIIRNYTGEKPILDMSLPEFRNVGNTAWEMYDTTRQIYRSVKTYSNAAGNISGKMESGGLLYSLNVYPNDEAFSSDIEYVTADGIRYVGPGIFWNSIDSKIYIRLKPPSEESVSKIYNIPSDTDPRNNNLYISVTIYGLRFINNPQYLTIQGIQLAHFRTTIRIFSGHHLIFKEMEIIPGQNAFVLQQDVHDVLMDSVNMNLFFPDWIARDDVKTTIPPALSMKLSGVIFQDPVYNVEIRNCRFNDVFDGITAANSSHDIRVHHNEFETIDDALQLGSSSYHVEFSSNKILGVSASKHGSGSSLYPGTTYIHHNIFDARRQILFGRYDPFDLLPTKYDGWGYQSPHSHHEGIGFGSGDPWKIYNNTYLYYQHLGFGGAGRSLIYDESSLTRNAGVRHEVYNNIFVQHSDAIVMRGGRTDDGWEIRDGNLYYRAVANPTEKRFFFEQWYSETAYSNFQSLAEFKNSPLNNTTKSYYSPGWEANGIEMDPQLDANVVPLNSAAWHGGVDLSAKDWPGTADLEGAPYRGAIAPETSGVLSGDLNGDSRVTLEDLRIMIYMLVGQAPVDLAKADLDKDGKLSLADLNKLIGILVSGG